MEITLKRETRTEKSTIGKLTVGDFGCFVLEDKDRGLTSDMTAAQIKEIKVQGKTAIPSGRHEIAITFSNKFQKFLPLLLNVKGFEGIRIHPGNVPEHTEGCLLPGKFQGIDEVKDSRKAFNELFAIIKDAAKKEKIFITIS